MDGTDANDHDQSLLRRYAPVLKYDSHEAFFANHVQAMTDAAAWCLARATEQQGHSTQIIANHAPGPHPLNLDFLALDGQGHYPNGDAFADGDHFSLQLIGPDAFTDRSGDYRALEHQIPTALRDRVFGRAVRGQDGVWLQDWFFYIYNDAQFGGRVDLHEGDWEMVQFLIGDRDTPVTAIYAQHAYAQRRPWENVELDPPTDGRPVIYVGRGSHASYFEPGLRRTYVQVDDHFEPLWWDAADGNGRPVTPRLEPMTDPWAQWPGVWGGTKARIPLLDGDSPQAPRLHEQWDRPDAFAANARADLPEPEPLPAPPDSIEIQRSGLQLALKFTFTQSHDPSEDPDRLVITAVADGEMPVTETIVVDALAAGAIITRQRLAPEKHYTVTLSTISRSGRPTGTAKVELPRLPETGPGHLIQGMLDALDEFWRSVGKRLSHPRHNPPPGHSSEDTD
jgi:hypothetical protein